MSNYAKRIGSYLKKRSRCAVGICGTAVITASVMCRTNLHFCYKKESKDHTDKTKGRIFDLEEIGKQEAWAMYEIDQQSNLSVNRKKKELVLQLNWDDVKSYPEKPDYKLSPSLTINEGAFRVIFEAVFQNITKTDQCQKIKAVVETLSTSHSSLTQGYTKGSEVGLTLKAPDQVATTFSNGLAIKHVNGNFEVKPIPWVVDKLIKVPKYSNTTVSMEVQGRQSEFDFEANIGFEGDIKGNFCNQNQEIVASYTIPIKTIIKELPKDMISEKKGINYIKINGRCAFRYDTGQLINIS